MEISLNGVNHQIMRCRINFWLPPIDDFLNSHTKKIILRHNFFSHKNQIKKTSYPDIFSLQTSLKCIIFFYSLRNIKFTKNLLRIMHKKNNVI